MSHTAHPSRTFKLEDALTTGGKYLRVLLGKGLMTIEDLERLASNTASRPGFSKAIDSWRSEQTVSTRMLGVPETPNERGVRLLLRQLIGMHRSSFVHERGEAYERLVKQYRQHDMLRTLLLILSERQRTIIILRHGILDGSVLTLKEVAEYLHLSQTTVRRQESQALQSLRLSFHLERDLEELEQQIIDDRIRDGEIAIEDLRLEEAGLVRLLHSYHIHFVSRLADLTEQQLEEMNVKRYLDEIKTKLAALGFSLRGEPSQQQ